MDFVERNLFRWAVTHGDVKTRLNLTKQQSKMMFLLLQFALRNVYQPVRIKLSNVAAVKYVKALEV